MKGNAKEKRLGAISIWGALLFSVIAWLAFVLPDHPDALSASSFARLPLEWPLLSLSLLLLPQKFRQPLVFACGMLVLLLLVLKMADLGVQSAFQRQFNPYLDIKMMRDGWNLVSGTVGTATALLVLLCAVIGVLLTLALFLKAGKWTGASTGSTRYILIAVFSVITLAACLFPVTSHRPVDFNVPHYLAARLSLVIRSVEDMHLFEKQLSGGTGPRADAGLFRDIAGKDIIIVFVESYGRSALQYPLYADVTLPRLKNIETQLSLSGLKSVSAWSTSPTVGGLSWLAHGTLMSGLWVDSQARYDRLMISQQPSLNRLFAQAGWETVAVMPAITMAWPEADYFGYAQLLTASNLQYRGQPFNWVTMPDQYTLSTFHRLAIEPARAAGRNVMAEIALISSHAPWTPVPTMIDWDAVGDGSIFDVQAAAGDSPSVVWADAGRVRAQYVRAIDYSLSALGDYMARYGSNTVFVVLGDHQPAAIITGPNASRAVPVHIVTQDLSLLSRFRSLGFTDGMEPVASGKEFPMSDLRQMLIDAFGH